ncbi:type IIL restriction-modification enzyme MmeI, partial [Pseudarthrobacter enclensis]|nr:hypothetical protein [Pseudarthrobacter enclensis]
LFGKGFGHEEHPSTRKDQILTGKVSIKPSAVPDAEKDDLLEVAPQLATFIRGFSGSDEFIKRKTRWCLVIPDSAVEEVSKVFAIARRLDGVRAHREKSTEKSTKAMAATPNRFYFWAHRDVESIIVPKVSSARREYIPIGYMDPDTVISDLAFAAYDAKPWVFALLTSAMQMAWTRAVAGQMKTDYRYSSTLVYNNFPVPPLSDSIKDQLTVAALRVLDVREYHCEKTLAELYDPDLMPADLRAAHEKIDSLVDSIYSKRNYETDEQRLSDLFALYEEMTAAESAKGSKKK